MAKRWLVLTVAMLVVVSLASACAQKPAEPAEKPEAKEAKKEEPKPAAPQELFMATGGTGGTYFGIGGAIANVWNKYAKTARVTIQPSGASVENLRLLSGKKAQLALAMNNVADAAWNGTGDFKDKPVEKNWLAVGCVYPDTFQGVALADRKISTIPDLKGKKVAVGPPGSGSEVNTRLVLRYYNMSYDDIQEEFATFADATAKMKDGLLDASFGVLGVPAGAIQEITTVRQVTLIELDRATIDKIIADNPTCIAVEIPAGTYKGQEKDVWTIANPAVLYASKDLPDDVVYELTKVMYENSKEIAQAHSQGAHIKLETAVNGITTPIHPGALKYYKEKGIQVKQ